MLTSTNKSVVIGKGALNWDVFERRSDRYGSITLYNEPERTNSELAQFTYDAEAIAVPYVDEIGEYGTLVATVLEAVPSYHIGDWFRNARQEELPEVEKTYTLGEGVLFYEDNSDFVSVGVRPVDGRHSDWMDIKVLYALHNSVVRLEFVPKEKPTEAV